MIQLKNNIINVPSIILGGSKQLNLYNLDYETNKFSVDTNILSGQHDIFVVKNSILLTTGKYTNFILTQDLKGLLNEVSKNYIQDKIGINSFSLKSLDDKPRVNFGVNTETKNTWNELKSFRKYSYDISKFVLSKI